MQRTTLLAAFSTAIGAASLPAFASTISYYRMEGTGTTATLTDSSSNGYNATTVNSPTYSTSIDTSASTIPQTGQTNTSSLALSGTYNGPSNQYATSSAAGTAINFGSTTAMTIQAYVQLSTLGTATNGPRDYVEMAKRASSADTTLDFAFLAQAGTLVSNLGPHSNTTDEQLMFEYESSGTIENIVSSLAIADNNWHFISVAVDPTTGNVRFTLDNQSDSFTISSMPAPTGYNAAQIDYIGGHLTSTGASDFTLNGALDELETTTGTGGVNGTGFLSADQLLNAPEPSSLGLISVACLGLLRRCRATRNG